MCAAMLGGNQIDVAFRDHIPFFSKPGHRPIDFFVRSLEMPDERLLRHRRLILQLGGEVGHQAVLVEPLLVLRLVVLVDELDAQPGREHRLRSHHVLEPRDVEFRGIEEFLVRPEANGGAGVAFPDFADGLQLGALFSVGEPHGELFAAAPHPHLQLFGERVDDGDADAVQPAGEAIVLLGEFRPGVQPREDHFDAGDAFLRMFVDRHAAPVIGHRHRAVLVQRDHDFIAVAGDGLVRGVVDDLLRQVIGPLGGGVHPRPLADGLEAGEDFDRRTVVTCCH